MLPGLGKTKGLSSGLVKSRMISVKLGSIAPTDRLSNAQVDAKFNNLAGGILGALLDGVVSGLKHEGQLKFKALPRMADFAIWAAACSMSYQEDPLTFLTAYAANRADMLDEQREADVVADAIIGLVEPGGSWEGTAKQLKGKLEMRTEYHGIAQGWPRSPKALSDRITRAEQILKAHGITVRRFKRHRCERVIELVRAAEPKQATEQSPSAAAAPPQDNITLHQASIEAPTQAQDRVGNGPVQ